MARTTRRSPGFSPLLLLINLIPLLSAQYIPALRRDSFNRPIPHLSPRDDSQDSTNNALYLVSHSDFCVYGPPDPFSQIESTGLNVVSWCSQAGHGTRLIPDGALHGVTYVKANNWVQVSGTGDFTKINIAPGDEGGQLDSGSNKPNGAQMYVSDDNQAASNWVTMISASTFCVRACTGDASFCPTDFDQMGCWFFTGNSVGADGTWQDCQSDHGDPPGVVDGTTFSQGGGTTPTPTAASLSNCQTGGSVSNGQSEPPLYSWGGSGSAVAIGGAGRTSGSDPGGATDSGSSGSSSGSSSGGRGSTSWIAVPTCTPCSRGGSHSTGSDAAPGVGGMLTSATTSAASSTGSASSNSSSNSTDSSSNGTSSDGSDSTSGNSTSNDTASYHGTDSGGNDGSGDNSSSSSESGSTNSGATKQVGITQMSSAGGIAISSGSSSASSGGKLNRRDGGTTTSGGQCCFTTWTPSVVGGAGAAGPTGASGAQGANGTTGGNGITGAHGTTGTNGTRKSGASLSGIMTGANISTAMSVSGLGFGSSTGLAGMSSTTPAGITRASKSGTAGSEPTLGGTNGTNVTGGGGNGTNSSGNGSSAGMRLTIEGVEGLRKVISGIGISVLIGAGLGGFVLL